MKGKLCSTPPSDAKLCGSALDMDRECQVWIKFDTHNGGTLTEEQGESGNSGTGVAGGNIM